MRKYIEQVLLGIAFLQLTEFASFLGWKKMSGIGMFYWLVPAINDLQLAMDAAIKPKHFLQMEKAALFVAQKWRNHIKMCCYFFNYSEMVTLYIIVTPSLHEASLQNMAKEYWKSFFMNGYYNNADLAFYMYTRICSKVTCGFHSVLAFAISFSPSLSCLMSRR